MRTALTNPLVRRDPFAEPFGSLFDEFFSDFGRGWMRPMWSTMAELPVVTRARMDLLDKGDKYEIVVDLPGVKKDDINVSVEGARVSITAEAKAQREVKEDEKLLYTERDRASYARSFELPAEVTEKGADAHFEDGVLTLTLPKREPLAAKRLAVH